MISPELQAKLREEYNPDGSPLRNAQKRMLEILCCVDDICKAHNIDYWLTYGSLLGAVRHGGFIPWDDDLDIEMLEKDYKKLLPILEKELPPNLCLQNRKHEKHFINNFTKVRDKKSRVFETTPMIKRYAEHGLFIDIFPIKRTWKPLTIISGYWHYCCYKLSIKSESTHKISLLLSWILYNVVCPIFNFITIFFHDKDYHITYGTWFFQERKGKDIFPVDSIEFEGRKFPCPHDSDSYLKRLYGDYMKLPDEKHIHMNSANIQIW